MSKVILFIVILVMIFFGVRKILLDWKARFGEIDQVKKQRDQKERARPDVMELKRDKDGVFRPPSSSKSSDKKD